MATVETTAQAPTVPSAGHLWTGPTTIAIYTWREGIRKKTLIGFLLLSLLVIFGSFFITAFMAQVNISGDLDPQIEIKIIKDICVSAISVFGILITIFVSASVVPAEMENKVIYTVLTKPVKRFQYLLGKFLGVQIIVIVNLALMSLLFFIALYAKEEVWPTLLLWSTLLTYFQFLIVSAYTFAVSCTSTSAVLPTIAGLFIFIVGNATEYLKDVSQRVADAAGVVEQMLGYLAWGLHAVLPNLQNFNLRNDILNLAANDPPSDVLIPNLIVYAVIHAAVGFVIAWVVFYRREL